MILMATTEVKLRKHNDSFSGSLDESRLKSNSHKEWLTHSSSAISNRSVDHIDPLLITSNPPTDCVDSATDQQLAGNRDVRMTSLKSACQVSMCA